MTQSRLIAPYARRGLLATALFLAIALVASSWMNHRAARAAVTSLNRGQLDLIDVQLREAFHPWNPPPDSVALHAFMEANPESAIRYIALFDEVGAIRVSAGTPASAAAPPAGVAQARDVALDLVGERVRAYLMRPSSSLSPPLPPDAQSDRGFGQRRTVTAGGRSLVFTLVEFEPVVATSLVNRAQLSLVLGGVAAALLALAALVFWRQSLLHEAERREAEHRMRLSQLGEMSAVLAHEIRNPLASLKGNAQLLVERLDPNSREVARAERVVHEATRLQALTSDLLDFARSGPVDLRRTSPTELLRVAVEEVDDPDIEVDCEAAPAEWTLDETRIRQALVNLLRNAVQVSPPGRPPVAAVGRSGRRLTFEVRDFGPGLREGDRERIFEPFFTTRTSGTGLGLSVARRAVELHGGHLSADNHSEGGAVFRISLPDGPG